MSKTKTVTSHTTWRWASGDCSRHQVCTHTHTHTLTHKIYIYMSGQEKKRSSFFFFLFCVCCFTSGIKRCMALHFNTTKPDLMQHATPHSSSPTTTSKLIHWPSMSPDLNPNKHAWNELETSLRQNEHPCKHAWIVSGTRAGVGGHPKASDLQPDPVHAWEMLGS